MTPSAMATPITVRMQASRRRGRAEDHAQLVTAFEPGPARLLADLPAPGEWRSLAHHRSLYPPPPPALSKPNERLIDVVGRAGLRGRGGAGFPMVTKLSAVANGPRGRVVVANATEGEPASAKDRLLASRLPHLVLDGAALAALAVGADEVIVCVDRTNRQAAAALERACRERREKEAGSCPVRVALTPPRYVAGEETALVNFLNGGPSKPTVAPPRPFERGVGRRPTLVQNVETLAHLTQIAAFGDEWFRHAGTAAEPGTSLFTVSGTTSPTVVEAALGTLGGLVLEGAGTLAGERLQAVLVGGYFGTWLTAGELAATPLSSQALGPLGASPGAGILVALPESSCGLLETARILTWYAGESAGQCGPCTFGLPALAGRAGDLAAGRGRDDDVAVLRRWAGDIEGRGACRHPDGAVRLLRSALAVFAADVEAHLRGRPCDGAVRPSLAVPISSQEWR